MYIQFHVITIHVPLHIVSAKQIYMVHYLWLVVTQDFWNVFGWGVSCSYLKFSSNLHLRVYLKYM